MVKDGPVKLTVYGTDERLAGEEEVGDASLVVTSTDKKSLCISITTLVFSLPALVSGM